MIGKIMWVGLVFLSFSEFIKRNLFKMSTLESDIFIFYDPDEGFVNLKCVGPK